MHETRRRGNLGAVGKIVKYALGRLERRLWESGKGLRFGGTEDEERRQSSVVLADFFWLFLNKKGQAGRHDERAGGSAAEDKFGSETRIVVVDKHIQERDSKKTLENPGRSREMESALRDGVRHPGSSPQQEWKRNERARTVWEQSGL